MDKTAVVNLRLEDCDLYIGRGSRWGNPFRIGKDGTREEVVQKYATWIRAQPILMANLKVLRGMRLGCYCKPRACHGDVLVLLVEEERIAKKNREIVSADAKAMADKKGG